MKTQYGDLLRTDVSENSMTFKIEGDITTNLGRYAIVPVEDSTITFKLAICNCCGKHKYLNSMTPDQGLCTCESL